jgi:hypothetical protein
VPTTGDVEAGRVPEQIRLRAVPELDRDGDMKPDRLGQRVAAFRRPSFLGGACRGRGSAVLLEATTGVEARDESDVVKQRRDVEQLDVEAHAVAFRERDGEEMTAKAVVRQEGRRHVFDELLGPAGETRIGPCVEHGEHCAT